VPADATYSFMKNFDDGGYLAVDRAALINDTMWSNVTVVRGVKLAKGWHDIEIRVAQGGGGVGPTQSRFASGIMYDPTDGDFSATNMANVKVFEDPGDGSVLRTDRIATMPQRVVLAGNASVDLALQNADFAPLWAGGLMTDPAAGSPVLTVAGGSGELRVGGLGGHAPYSVDAIAPGGVTFAEKVLLLALPTSSAWRIADGTDVALGAPALLGTGSLTLTNHSARVLSCDALGTSGGSFFVRHAPARERPGRSGAGTDAARGDGRSGGYARRAGRDQSGGRVHLSHETGVRNAGRRGMSAFQGFPFPRWWSMVLKEFLQLRRDRLTFAMIVGIPIGQLVLFGFAINNDPRHLPTAVICADRSDFTRSFLAAMRTSTYFDFVGEVPDEAAGRAALARGTVQFVVNIPADFTRRLLRGERPALLLEADATDPAATSMALAAAGQLVRSAAAKDLTGPLAFLGGGQEPFEVRVHRLYNPEGITRYNIIPGLIGVILCMTMVLMTGLAITRERERGTMENLLAMPVSPFEVMSGKLVPYIAIGLLQTSIILLAAHFLFRVPNAGGLLMVYLAALLFVVANLTVGIALSSFAANQMQAMQLTLFYFLPNIILSGFMFPFQGMPGWAQHIGNLLPLTYFMRLIRGIFLKGNPFWDLWPNIWPLMVFTTVVMLVAVVFYRRTLD